MLPEVPLMSSLSSPSPGRRRARPGNNTISWANDGGRRSHLTPLPPPTVNASSGRKRVTVDLARPLGMTLNGDCSVSAIVAGGQVDAVHGIAVGCVINVVEGTVVMTLAELKAELRRCREAGLKQAELAYRAGHASPPLRPLLLCILKRLESPDHANAVIAAKAHGHHHHGGGHRSPSSPPSQQLALFEAKPAAQGAFEEGVVGFLDVLKHVERGDYGWETLPPGARRLLEGSRDAVEAAANQGCVVVPARGGGMNVGV